MLTYIDFYCISEHLGAWDRGNMNIIKIGTKMTSGEPPIFKLDSPRCPVLEVRKWGAEVKPKSLIIAESSSKIWEAVHSWHTSSFPYNP